MKSHSVMECMTADARISALEAENAALKAKPVNMLLYCPHCAEQHVDEARPGICETCGSAEAECFCTTFTAWLNPPHKSHRCNFCNYVWRPADVPTNGVAAIQTKGRRDEDAKPREAKAWDAAESYRVALESANARAEAAEKKAEEYHLIIDANRWPDTAAKLLREVEGRANTAEAEAARLREALEKYANEDNWEWCVCGRGPAQMAGFTTNPGFSIAQTALREERETA